MLEGQTEILGSKKVNQMEKEELGLSLGSSEDVRLAELIKRVHFGRFHHPHVS